MMWKRQQFFSSLIRLSRTTDCNKIIDCSKYCLRGALHGLGDLFRNPNHDYKVFPLVLIHCMSNTLHRLLFPALAVAQISYPAHGVEAVTFHFRRQLSAGHCLVEFLSWSGESTAQGLNCGFWWQSFGLYCFLFCRRSPFLPSYFWWQPCTCGTLHGSVIRA